MERHVGKDVRDNATKWACDTANIGVHHAYLDSGQEADMSELLLYARIYGVPGCPHSLVVGAVSRVGKKSTFRNKLRKIPAD